MKAATVNFGTVFDPVNALSGGAAGMLNPGNRPFLAELLHVFPQKEAEPGKKAAPSLHLVVTNENGPSDLEGLKALFEKAIPMMTDSELETLKPESKTSFLGNLLIGLFGEQGLAIDSGRDRVLVKVGGGTRLPGVEPGLYLFEGEKNIAMLKAIAERGGIDLHQALNVDA